MSKTNERLSYAHAVYVHGANVGRTFDIALGLSINLDNYNISNLIYVFVHEKTIHLTEIAYINSKFRPINFIHAVLVHSLR